MTVRRVKLGLILPLFSGDTARSVETAQAAEADGFDGVFGFDHFFPPEAPSNRPSVEVYTTLAAVAATTERVALGTLVTRAVLRPAGMIAKLAATLDVISGGRMVLGIGSGDPIDAPEHVAYGFPNLGVRDRRTHMGETVAAVKALFRGEPYSGGTHVPAISGPLLPPPVRDGGPPVWLGGQGDQVVRLAGGLADGWNGWGMAPEAFRGKVDTLEEEAGALGREVEATWAGIVVVGEDEADAERISAGRKDKGIMGDAFSGSAEHFAEFVRQLADERATWVIVVLAGPADRRELVAEKVLPALAAG